MILIYILRLEILRCKVSCKTNDLMNQYMESYVAKELLNDFLYFIEFAN